MKAVNAIGLGDKHVPDHSPAAKWETSVNAHGAKIQRRVPEPADQDAFFRVLGKASLGALGLGGLAAMLTSINKGTAPLSSRQDIVVPLTDAEQQMLLEKRKKGRKLGSVDESFPVVDTNTLDGDGATYRELSDGTVVSLPAKMEKTWWTVPGRAFNRINFIEHWKNLGKGAPVMGYEPEAVPIGRAAKPQTPAAGEKAPSGSVASSILNSPASLPLGAAGIAAAGGLGYWGLKSFLDARRKKKLQAKRDEVKRMFMDSLLTERDSKVGSAIDTFVSACEEKIEVKEAGGVETFLGLLGLAGVAAGGAGFYNGLVSDPQALRRIKAMRKARARQIALQEEFDPQIRSDLSFLPQRLGVQPVELEE